MRARVAILLGAVLILQPAFAIESQRLAEVERLPAALDWGFPCGQWSVGGAQGHYRVVVASVYGGAGSEVYLQRIEQTTGSQPELVLVETVAFPRLNDDHAQYSVTSARCRGNARFAFVELVADYEHDVGKVSHVIRIELKPPYRVTDKRVSVP